MTTAAKKVTDKKKAPKKVAPKKALKKNKKNSAIGFLNWAIPMENGKTYRSSKGFPIFQNPKYPNPEEDTLLKLAEENGGQVELTMKVRIMLLERPDPVKPDFSEFIIN